MNTNADYYRYSVTIRDGNAIETRHGGGCLAITGYSPDEYVSNPNLWYQMIHVEDREAVLTTLTRIISGKNSRSFEHRIRRKDGSPGWVRNTPILRHDEQGNFSGYDGLVEDITEYKDMEISLGMLKDEAVVRLAGGIAHDFNNIMTGILGYSAIMKRRLVKNDLSYNDVNEIEVLAKKASALTYGLLAFSRHQVMNFKPEDVNNIVDRFYRTCSCSVRVDIKVSINLAADHLTVMADNEQLESVLSIFVSNAVDAMPTGGRLELSTELSDNSSQLDRNWSGRDYVNCKRYAVISVSDTGEGLDNDIRERIFDPFSTTKEVGKGTGLGLAIACGIVKQHSGYIDISSTCYGTEFKVFLPLLRKLNMSEW